MDDTDLAAWQALPSEVEIWRGCSRVNTGGLSWSLSKETAAGFPMQNRYHPPQGEKPILLRAVVHKAAIAAVKFDREESEVILAEIPAFTEHDLPNPERVAAVGV